jgi:hypothetical protein
MCPRRTGYARRRRATCTKPFLEGNRRPPRAQRGKPSMSENCLRRLQHLVLARGGRCGDGRRHKWPTCGSEGGWQRNAPKGLPRLPLMQSPEGRVAPPRRGPGYSLESAPATQLSTNGPKSSTTYPQGGPHRKHFARSGCGRASARRATASTKGHQDRGAARLLLVLALGGLGLAVEKPMRSSSARVSAKGSRPWPCPGWSAATRLGPSPRRPARHQGARDRRARLPPPRAARQRIAGVGPDQNPAWPRPGRRTFVIQWVLTNPHGYCPDHSTGVSCPVGLGVRAGEPATTLEQV